MSLEKLMKRMQRQARLVRPDIAYTMGKDCALHGANGRNCHFSIFRTPEMTAEWERGKRDGDAIKHLWRRNAG